MLQGRKLKTFERFCTRCMVRVFIRTGMKWIGQTLKENFQSLPLPSFATACNVRRNYHHLPSLVISCYIRRNHLLQYGWAKLATNASMFAPLQLCQFDETGGTFQLLCIMIAKRVFSCLILVIGSNDGGETKRNSSSSKQIHFAISRLVVWQKSSCAKSWRILLSDFLTCNSLRRRCLVWWRVVRVSSPIVFWKSDGMVSDGLCLTFTLKKMENLPSCQILWATLIKKILSDAASHSRRSHQSVWCTRSRSSL